MANFKTRIVKLEKRQSSGLLRLSDEDLNTKITELCNKPDIHDWLVDDTNSEPVRLRVIELITQRN